MEHHDEALRSAVRAVQLGDIEAFSVIVETLQPGLSALAGGYFRNPEDTLEMTQEFFIHLYERLDRYREGKAAFRTWCWTVARNFFLKKVKKRGPIITPAEDSAVFADTRGKSAARHLSDEETRREVEDALHELPEKYRLPLTLFYFEEFAYNDIAAVTGLPLGTVRTHLLQGKRRLKEQLRHLALDWGEEA